MARDLTCIITGLSKNETCDALQYLKIPYEPQSHTQYLKGLLWQNIENLEQQLRTNMSGLSPRHVEFSRSRSDNRSNRGSATKMKSRQKNNKETREVKPFRDYPTLIFWNSQYKGKRKIKSEHPKTPDPSITSLESGTSNKALNPLLVNNDSRNFEPEKVDEPQVSILPVGHVKEWLSRKPKPKRRQKAANGPAGNRTKTGLDSVSMNGIGDDPIFPEIPKTKKIRPSYQKTLVLDPPKTIRAFPPIFPELPAPDQESDGTSGLWDTVQHNLSAESDSGYCCSLSSSSETLTEMGKPEIMDPFPYPAKPPDESNIILETPETRKTYPVVSEDASFSETDPISISELLDMLDYLEEVRTVREFTAEELQLVGQVVKRGNEVTEEEYNRFMAETCH